MTNFSVFTRDKGFSSVTLSLNLTFILILIDKPSLESVSSFVISFTIPPAEVFKSSRHKRLNKSTIYTERKIVVVLEAWWDFRLVYDKGTLSSIVGKKLVSLKKRIDN